MTVVGASSADADDFQTMAAPHLVTMRRLAARLTSVAESDRVVNAALARAWRSRAKHDDTRRSAQGWLLAIVAERAKRHRARRRPSGSELIDVADGVIELDPWLDLDAAIASLPWRGRLVIELFYGLGLGVEECAAVMACSAATVTSTLSEARAGLLGGVEQVDLS